MMLAEKGVLAQAVLLPHPPDVVVGPAPAEQAVLEAEGDQLRVEGRLLRPTSGGVNAPSGGRARGSVAMISEKRWPRGDGRWGRVAHVLFVVVEVRFHRGPRLRHIDVAGMQGVPQVAEPWHLHLAPRSGAASAHERVGCLAVATWHGL